MLPVTTETKTISTMTTPTFPPPESAPNCSSSPRRAGGGDDAGAADRVDVRRIGAQAERQRDDGEDGEEGAWHK